MTPPKNCDIVVIGGGPAGSMAAGLLAQKGYQVTLLEKSHFPRPHVGESLIPHFWKYTDLLGASQAIEQEGFVRKAGGTVIWNGVIRKMNFKDFGYPRPALHVERDRFDTILLQQATKLGVQTFQGAMVVDVELDSETGQQRLEYRLDGECNTSYIDCRMIIDASGQNGVISQRLNLRVIDKQFRFFSVWGYYRGASYIGADGVSHPHKDLESVPPTTFVTSLQDIGDWGWSWHIPLRDSTSVGLVLPIEAMATLKSSDLSREAWFEHQCRSTPILGDLLQGSQLQDDSVAFIRDYSYRTTTAAGPGYFLAGDAAGFVDPIFSVGIVFSLYSGYSAAWAVDRCLSDPASTPRYQTLYNSQLQKRLETSRALALPSYRPKGELATEALAGVGFESLNEQALMNVVATMTTRSANFSALGLGGTALAQATDKITILDSLNERSSASSQEDN